MGGISVVFFLIIKFLKRLNSKYYKKSGKYISIHLA